MSDFNVAAFEKIMREQLDPQIFKAFSEAQMVYEAFSPRWESQDLLDIAMEAKRIKDRKENWGRYVDKDKG